MESSLSSQSYTFCHILVCAAMCLSGLRGLQMQATMYVHHTCNKREMGTSSSIKEAYDPRHLQSRESRENPPKKIHHLLRHSSIHDSTTYSFLLHITATTTHYTIYTDQNEDHLRCLCHHALCRFCHRGAAWQ